ncbi:MAG: response regulator [Archangiaceae bacterium]|nr:response regulator [Archangiaceae bacterium]
MGALMRTIDWGRTAVGPLESWPQSLRTAVSILLESRFPMYIAWGPSFVQFYNDGYRPVLGSTKHPAAMGRSASETFAESWHIIGPMFEGVRRQTAVGAEDWMLPLDRHGYLEECYFTFSYSPIRDETGGVGGVLVTVTETTGRVLGERRLRTLRDLAARAGAVKRQEDAWQEAARALDGNAFDVPFALLYRVRDAVERPELIATTGWGADAIAATTRFAATASEPLWPFAEAAQRGPQLVTDLRGRFGDLPGGKWPEAPREALVLPISRGGHALPHGFLVVGVSARRALNDDYRGFLQLCADHLATAIINARAYEEEKRRAEALAEIDRAKTAFFSNVSHEFRTPLTLMLGPVEDGLNDTAHPLEPVQRERQELVQRNGRRLQKLVNTLLDFARIEAGRASAALAPTDLSSLTAELASSFKSAMAAAGLSLEVDCPPLPSKVYVDPSMWEKIVLNLLSNALKYTFAGGVRVALEWLGATVQLTVADTGAGIEARHLPHLFERFYRVEGAKGRSHEGTGIGLALVQELARLHGGAVAVKSTVGRGTVFTVTLPTGSAHLTTEQLKASTTLAANPIGAEAFLADAGLVSSPSASTPPRATTATSGARLLLADDNADMRQYLTRLLSQHWVVDAVTDGAQALAAARASPPDLVLSDVMMPGLSGLELVRALRADERTRLVPILLLSARAGEEATVEGLESGADGYLVKPFSARELLARVEAQLAVSRYRLAALEAERTHGDESKRLLGEARRATRAREETLAVVSHDLRSPLSVILSAAELLKRAAPGVEGVQKQTETIQRSAERMRVLIEDLLDLASIDAGSLSISPQTHSAEALATEARESFERLAMVKGVTLTSEVEPGLTVVCDRDRVLQALGNLLSNAVKFTPAGGSVRLLVRRDERTRHIDFSVADTGPGIAAEQQGRVFDRYWHLSRENQDGHGLGLAIARGIVDVHGGELRLASTLGQGSTFTLSLPPEPGARLPRPAPVEPTQPIADEGFIQHGGEMGAMMRAFDWSTTPLGPLAQWPQSLRTSLSTMLRSPYPIILFWGPQRVMLYNDPFRPILGTKHPQTLGARGSEALAEEWKLLGPLMDGVLETGEPVFIENGNVNFQRRPGGLREEAYFTWSYNPTIGERGEIAGLFAIASETTRQVVGERRLGLLRELSLRTATSKRVEDVFRALEQVLAQGSYDLPFALLYAPDGGRARLVSCVGVERGSAAAPLEPGADGATPWPLAAVAASGQEQLLEALEKSVGALPGGPWPEPSTRALLLPVPMGAEGETGVLVAGLSPLRAADGEYRSFLQLLARQVSASVASARAYQQEKQRAEELARLDQAKTAFFSNVSHEFRTPLTLILGPVEDALSGARHALEGNQLELVRRNALRLYKMVNTLLDFSRMESGRAEATYVEVDLAEHTRNLASNFQSAAESGGLKLTIDCPPLPARVYVDVEMWEKIVLNLLSNAVKYTHRGEIARRLRWESGGPELTLTDTGVGIPPADLPRVFERFYRVRSTEGRSHEGTGIGLAMVQELVKLHGGTVTVASELGRGTTFTVRLPGGSAHLPAEKVARPSLARASGMPGAALFVEEARRWSEPELPPAGVEPLEDLGPLAPELKQSRILLVDDNADLRSYVAGALGQVFPNVETAKNGLEALERARAHPPNLVLSDVMMPGLDGFGLVRELRADPATRAIPVVLLSARAGDESAVEGLGSGADDYLVKPFSMRELLARVRTQLEMVRVRREVVSAEVEKAQLRQSVQTRDEFLNLVNHELRTPVSALLLNVQAVSRSTPELLPGRVKAMQQTLDRMTRLVQHLTVASELVTGALELSRESSDLGELVNGVVERARAKAPADSGAITLAPHAQVRGVFDRQRLEQAVEALVDNAIKFSDGHPVEVSVSRHDGHATVSVTDQGIGVAPEHQPRLFERFERGVPSSNYGGFGLGLWLARQVAQAHGGGIRFSPTPGGGATFSLELPV